MKTPNRILIYPTPISSLLQPMFLLRLVRFRWRIIMATVVISSAFAIWSASQTHSARTIIYVEGLGPGGSLTNVDYPGMPVPRK